MSATYPSSCVPAVGRQPEWQGCRLHVVPRDEWRGASPATADLPRLAPSLLARPLLTSRLHVYLTSCVVCFPPCMTSGPADSSPACVPYLLPCLLSSLRPAPLQERGSDSETKYTNVFVKNLDEGGSQPAALSSCPSAGLLPLCLYVFVCSAWGCIFFACVVPSFDQFSVAPVLPLLFCFSPCGLDGGWHMPSLACLSPCHPTRHAGRTRPLHHLATAPPPILPCAGISDEELQRMFGEYGIVNSAGEGRRRVGGEGGGGGALRPGSRLPWSAQPVASHAFFPAYCLSLAPPACPPFHGPVSTASVPTHPHPPRVATC